MAVLLKTASVQVSSIQIIQVRVQNKGKSVWKSRYDGDVSAPSLGKAWGLSLGEPLILPRSCGRRSGTTWRRALRHVSLRKSLGVESPTLRSSSPRPLRSFRKQEPCAAIDACLAWLPIQARMAGCASASTTQGSIELHLWSASGLRAWGVARAHRTASFACPSVCRTRM